MARTTRAEARGRVSPLPVPGWKRSTDVTVTLLLGIVMAPVGLFVALVSALVMGRPVLFRQARGGLGGEPFEIIKFRTMTDARDGDGRLLPDDQRRHWWGDLLRKTSLDELPTLLNILRGDMSLVGPRPLMARYLDRYSPRQAQRHRVTPGLTGLAQTEGRNLLSWEDKFELDLRYLDSRSPTTDLRIMLNTVSAVISAKGADGNDHTTEFFGSESESTSMARG